MGSAERRLESSRDAAYPRLSWKFLQIYNTAVDSSEFYDFMKDPSIPKTQKKPALESILQKLNCHDITQRFFGAMQHAACSHAVLTESARS